MTDVKYRENKTELFIDGGRVLSLFGRLTLAEMQAQYDNLVSADRVKEEKRINRYILKLGRKYGTI